MSRKSLRRSVIKQKRRLRRKNQKQRKRMAHMDKTEKATSDINNVLSRENNQQQNDWLRTEQRPSTSRDSGKRQISPIKNNHKSQSQWRSAGGKVNIFKKIFDDKARKLIKRSVHIMKDNKSPRKVTPGKKGAKRLINKNKTNSRRTRAKSKSNNTDEVINLEESEIHTDDETLGLNTSAIKRTANYNSNEEDDDDCVLIEPHVAEITIEDDNEHKNDDDFSSCIDVSCNYQSIVQSFRERVSSTPSHSSKIDIQKKSGNQGEDSNEVLPYFVDVYGRGCGIETINSTDSFIDYTTLSTTLDDKEASRQQQECLKEKSCNEIINLDLSQSNVQSLTLKRKSSCNDDHDNDDDSIIFVSETNKNDFISINDSHLLPPHKILKKSETPATPVNHQRINNTLFTLSETKKINEYNKNAYNPGEKKKLTSGKRMVIIDGSNVAFKHGLDQAFSVKGLKIAIEYFEKMGHEVKGIIPQFRMNKTKSTDPEELERLHKAGKIVQTPCKNLPGLQSTSYDDRFILQLAFELDAVIVSNDNYRDLLHENPAFKKIIENRVIGYTWFNDIFILPKDPYGKWGPPLQRILNR